MAGHDDLEAEGLPDLDEPINDDEGMIPPRDYPQGVDEFGVTAAEQRLGETLEDRVRREEPDFGDDSDGDTHIHGRIVDPADEDVDDIDDEKDLVGMFVDDDEGLAAEEAAIHIIDEP
jgi:hypothetical protein